MKLATLCYLEKDDSYLMLHRNKRENDMHFGKWIGLGGKIEPGESPEECVIREVCEESGLTVYNPILKGIMTFNEFSNDKWYVFLFTSREFSGELKTCDEGELAWVRKDSLDSLPMHDGDRLFMKWMTECYGVFSVKFNYEEAGLKNYEIVWHMR